MSNIENRAVKMEFDNATFQDRVSQTMASLSKLQKSLDFANSTKSMNDLSNAGKHFSLGGMASAVEGVSGKFLALATIGITALSNITNKAVDAGLRIAKSLTLEPVLEGFKEYETNMNSIQTVLANTRSDGTTLQNVNDALQTLNEYSDQTIYNFGEMAKNIGTFTAAGVSLDSSTAAIKGIANLAAVSGSNSQQASTAMYQLSQALAGGTLRLIDWNSVVNAGMGGEVFQKALYETGKAMKTIETGDVDQTFEEWTAAGNTFRESLESGWITAEVLTNTLQGFTGDMDAAQLAALGYTEAQAAEIIEMGKVAKAAATEVKTLTQLRGTIQESVASGWSQSFKLIVGDFEEAKVLFTEINDVVGGMVGRQADARNKLLEEWKYLGGRTMLIEGIRNAFEALGGVLAPIQRAFRDIFPKKTSTELFQMTRAFADFTEKLRPTSEQITKIRIIAQGFFAALEIGWTVVKETAKFIKQMFHDLVPTAGAGKAVDFFVDLGKKLNDLNHSLVENGGITQFFKDLRVDVNNFVETAKKVFKALDFSSFKDFLTSLTDVKTVLQNFGGDTAGSLDSFGAIGGKFEWLTGLSETLVSAWDGVKEKFKAVGDGVVEALDNMRDNFSNIGSTLGGALESADWGQVTDGLKIGLLGAIILFVKRLKDQLNFKFAEDVMKSISGSLNQLTGVLEAMQLKLKAEALQKIAIAIGILAASVLLLSTIDPEDLAKAMTALAVGFGQLIAAFALLTQLSSGPMGAASLVATAGGIILLSVAIGLLVLSVKGLSTIDWDDLAKGLLGVGTLLFMITKAVGPLSKNSGGMITAGLGMIAIGVALNIMALAVKQFGNMDWEEMGKGLLGVAGALAAVTASMKLLPKGMALKSVGVLLVAVALNALALAVKQFGNMDWNELGKGLLGAAGGLVAIGLAMNLMPASMVLTGPALLVVAYALNKISDSVIKMAALSWKELGKGLTGLAGMLVGLAIGLGLMSGTIPGAIAVGIAALSLKNLAKVVKEFSNISWGDLLQGLAGMAATLGVLGVAGLLLGPVVPILLALGVALTLIGAGFALFGVGAKLTAEAFAVLAELGAKGIAGLVMALDAFISRIPEFLKQLGLGLVGMATEFVKASPPLVTAFAELLKALLEAIPTVMPAFGTAVTSIIQTMLRVIRDNFPDIVTTGLEMLIALLKGIRDNMFEITTLTVEIIVEFVNGIAANMDKIVTAGVDLVIALVAAIIGQLFRIDGAAVESVGAFVGAIPGQLFSVAAAGVGILAELIKGMAQEALKLPALAVAFVLEFISGLPGALIFLLSAGAGIIADLASGIWTAITGAATDALEKAKSIGEAIIEGIKKAIKSGAQSVKDSVVNMAKDAASAALNPLGIGGPSTVFMAYGEWIVEGLTTGIDDNAFHATEAATRLGSNVAQAFNEAIMAIPDENGFIIIDPVIKPTLDLTDVKNQAKNLNNGLQMVIPFQAGLANNAATAEDLAYEENTRRLEVILAESTQPAVREVKFEQNNYSPKALTTTDIARRTRSQIALAKDKLELTS